LVLTRELSQSYKNFIIALDTTNPENLTITYVITHILNDEAQQAGLATSMTTNIENAMFATHSEKHSLAFITYYNFGKKGHYQSSCSN
jgi:hypothetical protein